MTAGERARATAGPWARSAACRDVGTAHMYPPPDRPDAMRAAVGVCLRCPVRLDCLRHALENREEFGVWGGTTAKQRWKLAKHIDRKHLTIEEVLADV